MRIQFYAHLILGFQSGASHFNLLGLENERKVFLLMESMQKDLFIQIEFSTQVIRENLKKFKEQSGEISTQIKISRKITKNRKD